MMTMLTRETICVWVYHCGKGVMDRRPWSSFRCQIQPTAVAVLQYELHLWWQYEVIIIPHWGL